MKTKIIAIEGIDGAGKTLQFKKLKEALSKIGTCISLDFPNYDGFFGQELGLMLSGKNKIKSNELDAKSLALWFACDRYEKFKNLNYQKYDFLILNRYILSNIVYQKANYDGNQLDFIKWTTKLENKIFELPVADIYFILDINYKLAKINIQSKGNRKFLGNELDLNEKNEIYLNKIRNSYIDSSKEYKNTELVNCLDKDNLLLTPEQIFEKIIFKLKKKKII